MTFDVNGKSHFSVSRQIRTEEPNVSKIFTSKKMRSLLTIVWLLAISLALFETPTVVAESAETALEYPTKWVNFMPTNNVVSGQRTTSTVPNLPTKETTLQVIRLGRII